MGSRNRAAYAKAFGETAHYRIGKRIYSNPRFVLETAIKLQAEYLAGYQSYLEDCEADRANGYRAHYCEHGTNLWTDYDNICGGCEDGATMGDGAQRRERALCIAKARWAELTAMVDVSEIMQRHGIAYDRKAYALTMDGIANPGVLID